ncbi:hypothetical protein [Stetteria hydrogenophila]
MKEKKPIEYYSEALEPPETGRQERRGDPLPQGLDSRLKDARDG